MQDFKRGTARANQLTFEYLTQGEGPLALCVHGFPDSPYSYRYLLPALAEAGDRAVAPFNRGFAPTELPADRHHIHSSTMAADQIALHEALGGDSDAILIAHDWGAVGAWGAAGRTRPVAPLCCPEHPAVRDLRREHRQVRPDQAVVLLLVLPESAGGRGCHQGR